MSGIQKFLTAGEFAQLCGATKETLRHYRNLGLLKPVRIAANGYQYYTPYQFFDFYLIQTLKLAGSSLKEIKAYLAQPGNRAYLTMLRQKQSFLHQQRLQLQRMERLLGQSIQKMEQVLEQPAALYQPQLLECSEQYLIASSVKQGETATDEGVAAALQQHLAYCQRHNLLDEFQLGAIISQAAFVSDELVESHYYSRLVRRVACSRLLVRPAGLYAVMRYDASGEDAAILQAHQQLKEFIAKQGLVVCGSAYEEELTIYQNDCDGSLYVIQLSVQVALLSKA